LLWAINEGLQAELGYLLRAWRDSSRGKLFEGKVMGLLQAFLKDTELDRLRVFLQELQIFLQPNDRVPMKRSLDDQPFSDLWNVGKLSPVYARWANKGR
jgi:hypothetical protein